jgi:alpha-L-rhamnosidase
MRPRPGGGLAYAKASLKTPYGLAKISWVIENGIFKLNAVIPPMKSDQAIMTTHAKCRF